MALPATLQPDLRSHGEFPKAIWQRNANFKSVLLKDFINIWVLESMMDLHHSYYNSKRYHLSEVFFFFFHLFLLVGG